MTQRQPFRIIQRDPPDDRSERQRALAALRSRTIPPALASLEESARDFRMDARMEDAINTALAVHAPLLLTGEPGTGKTQVAWYLKWYLDVELLPFIVRSTSTGTDLKYEFDAVAYLGNAQDRTAARQPRSAFLSPGVLWKAYESDQPCVVLIDEIDKAPRDFPNDLLHELDQNYFEHPFDKKDGRPIRIGPPAWGAPIVVITSNAERRLPDAFLRRCIVHHIRLDRALIDGAVAARKHGLNLKPGVQERAVDLFFEIRDKPLLQKKPATSELLTWLAALSAWEVDLERLAGSLRELPAIHALLKDHEDIEKL